MSSNLGDSKATATVNSTTGSHTWQLHAVTEALGDLTLTINDILSIGRGSDNDVVLGSKEVSRHHAQLSVLNGRLYVKDLGSSNSTFINDKRIEDNYSKNIKDADTVSFASFTFKVVAPVFTTVTAESPVTLADTDTVADSDNPILPEVTESTPEPIIEAATVTDSIIEPTHEPVIEAPVTPIIEAPVQDTATPEPVVKQTIIEEVLASDSPTQDIPVTPEQQDSEPQSIELKSIEPQASVEQAAEQSPVVEPDIQTPMDTEAAATTPTAEMSAATHDKTTTTALQEQADPDVLRAKQAATGQLSGTANLGQPKDIGTEGNNALDQALNNTANAGHVEKKPSGSWFIWVFAIIIIIALAIWLFNTGGA